MNAFRRLSSTLPLRRGEGRKSCPVAEAALLRQRPGRSNPARHSRSWLLLLLVSIAVTPTRAAETPTVEQIATVWRRRTADLELELRHETEGVFRFHPYQSDWSPDDDEAAVPRARLALDAQYFRFETVRWAAGEHGYKTVKQASSSVAQAFPERGLNPYFAALAAKFADPAAERREPFPFMRVFDGELVRDLWRDTEYPRGTISRPSPLGMVAPQAGDYGTPSQKLQDQTLFCAVLAAYPLHPYVSVQLATFQIAAEPAHVNGEPCLVLIDPPVGDSRIDRTLWLDPGRDFAVRRFMAKGPEYSIQCDIDYGLDPDLGWIPSEWTLSLRGTTGISPLLATRVLATGSKAHEPLADRELAIVYPPRTWVIDEPAAEQYLVLPDGTHRKVLPKEIYWLPTQAELLASPSGEVGPLIESKMRWRRYWQLSQIPAVLGACALLLATIAVWRRRRAVRTTIG